MTQTVKKPSTVHRKLPTTGMRARIEIAGKPTYEVSEKLLGQNIEAVALATAGMLTNRLENPKFVGPALPTGAAPGWLGGSHSTFRTELTVGMSLSGNESQWIYNGWDESYAGIIQSQRSVRAGETLVVDFWAKAISQPVKVLVQIMPPELRRKLYDEASTIVDASYWKNYRVELKVPEATDNATFQFLILGPGTLWVDQINMRGADEGHVSQDMLARLKTMRIPVLRFPGGCLSTNYHWKHGTGPVHLRPALHDAVFKMPVYYDFGTDEYLEMCRDQKITPMITVNIGSGTPDEAGEWAAYIADFYRRHGDEPPVAYFQMGNEQYGTWESSHMTGQMYVAALRDYIPKIRANYPRPRIVALGEEKFQTTRVSEDKAWRARVLEVVDELGIDVLTMSRYKGQWFDADIDKQINVAESVTKVQRDLEDMIQQSRRMGLKNTVSITEWNYWMTASVWDGKQFLEEYSTRHAMYVSGMIHMFARLGRDMELATFYHLINPMGIIQHRTVNVVESCVVDVFRMYRPAFDGTFVPLKLDSPLLGESETVVDSLCLKNSAGTWLFLANRHPAEAVTVQLDGLPDTPAECMMMAGDSPMGQLCPAEPPKVSDRTAVLPPLSLLRIRY